MAQAQSQSHGVNRPNPLGPYNPIRKHSEPERYLSIKINQSFTLYITSYLDIYISQNIRLCKGDFEGQFQTSLQARIMIFLPENSYLLYPFSFYFLQELSNPLLFAHCCCYFKKVDMFESHFSIKLQLKLVNSLE